MDWKQQASLRNPKKNQYSLSSTGQAGDMTYKSNIRRRIPVTSRLAQSGSHAWAWNISDHFLSLGSRGQVAIPLPRLIVFPPTVYSQPGRGCTQSRNPELNFDPCGDLNPWPLVRQPLYHQATPLKVLKNMLKKRLAQAEDIEGHTPLLKTSRDWLLWPNPYTLIMQIHIQMQTCRHTCTDTHVQTSTYRHTWKYRHTDTYIQTHTHTDTHTHAGTCTYRHTSRHTHTCTHDAHIQTHMQMQTQTCTITHIYTIKYVISCQFTTHATQAS